MKHWPSGSRDTVEWPDVGVEINPNFRDHLSSMIAMKGASWRDYKQQRELSGTDVADSRLRTYRKLYERLGLVHQEDDQIKLTSFGGDLSGLPSRIGKKKDELLEDLRRRAIRILARYQFVNPNEHTGPEDLDTECDIRPFATIWSAMLNLNGKLHPEELNRVLIKTTRANQVPGAIEQIRKARESCDANYSGRNLNDLLGTEAITDQPSARMASWFSLAGWGGLIIERRVDEKGFRNLVPGIANAINPALENLPPFRQFDTVKEWVAYYLGDEISKPEAESTDLKKLVPAFRRALEEANITCPDDFPIRLTTSLLAKRFLILTGLSGSGKTKLAQAFARWLTETYEESDPLQIGGMVHSDRRSFKITFSDGYCVELLDDEDPDHPKTVLLPRELIEEWARHIKENCLDRSVTVRELREGVKSGSRFDKQLHSLDCHLKAASFALAEADRIDLARTGHLIVPVGADWTGREHMLGYPDGINHGKYVKQAVLQLILEASNPRNRKRAFFLILDEMNLSHVERYFSDFLSAIESGEHIPMHEEGGHLDGVPSRLRLPDNLFVIGTVNVDETTYMFSPKVLDRANVIESRVNPGEFDRYMSDPRPIELKELCERDATGRSGKGRGSSFEPGFVKAANCEIEAGSLGDNHKMLGIELSLLFRLFQVFGWEFGYRVGSEIFRFTYIHRKLTGDGWDLDRALDAAIVQKLMPKLNGSEARLRNILKALACYCSGKEDEIAGGGFEKDDAVERSSALAKYVSTPSSDDPEKILLEKLDGNPDKAKYKLSFEKTLRMWRALKLNGFTSFAEN